MKEQMKRAQTTINPGKLIMLIAVICLGVVAIMWPTIKDSMKKEEIIYCHFETNFTQEDFQRYECKNMKIATKDMDMVNLSKFDELNNTKWQCSPNYETLPLCSGSNYYLSMFKLDVLCNNCGVDGYFCSESYIDYYTNETFKIMQYEDAFFQQLFSSEEALQLAFENCTGESYGQ